MKKRFTPVSFLKKNATTILLIFLVLISGFAHAYNMFHFPYYENDEGTYMSQAWSLLTHGTLEPYTYWYDHAPAGWIFIALWTLVTDGFYTFGVTVNSGRVFMLLLHLASTFYLFKITKKISGKTLAATIAVLLFSLSPLGIYYQRRVLLDNIMTFWTLFSLFLLTNTKSKLRFSVLSALTFGIAVLSKENAVFFIPAFIYVIYTKFNKHNRIFALVEWLTITFALISLYLIYALLKGEFFPVGYFGDSAPHVSLITTYINQVSRGANLPFWNTGSDFYSAYTTWLTKDPYIIAIGAVATLFTIIASFWNKAFRIPALIVSFFLLFLFRGKLVIDFYIVPLLPFLEMSIGMTIAYLIDKISFKKTIISCILGIIVCLGIGVFYYYHQIGQYTHDETTPQVEAINWIRNNIPTNANIVIDDYAYVDLHAPRYPGDKTFPNANWAWKIEDDPSVTLSKTDKNWTQTVYIALTHEIVKQIKSNNFPFIKQAILRSTLIQDWDDGYNYRNIPQFISTNGDWSSIYKVKDRNTILLDTDWAQFKNTYIHSYGQVINPDTKTTTSEGQAQALLLAAWEKDQSAFKGIWAWTHDHMQYRTQDKLFSSLFVKSGKSYVESDTAASSDADQDIAMALIIAGKNFNNPQYAQYAKQIVADIWHQEVVKINGSYYLTQGTDANVSNGYLINSYYLRPTYYSIFAQIDPSDPWNMLKTDTYSLLNAIPLDTLQKQNPIIIENGTGDIIQTNLIENANDDQFMFFWNVSVDALRNKDKNAIAFDNHFKTFSAKLFSNSNQNNTKNFTTIVQNWLKIARTSTNVSF